MMMRYLERVSIPAAGDGFNRKFWTRVRPGFQPRRPQRHGFLPLPPPPPPIRALPCRHTPNHPPSRAHPACVKIYARIYATRQQWDEFNISRTAVVRSTTAAAELIKVILRARCACRRKYTVYILRYIVCICVYAYMYIGIICIHTNTLVTCIFSDLALTHIIIITICLCVYFRVCCIYIYIDAKSRFSIYAFVLSKYIYTYIRQYSLCCSVYIYARRWWL